MLVWQGVGMAKNKVAGGFFWMLAILIGFGWGVAHGYALAGTLVGTLAGAAITLAIALVDRRRR